MKWFAFKAHDGRVVKFECPSGTTSNRMVRLLTAMLRESQEGTQGTALDFLPTSRELDFAESVMCELHDAFTKRIIVATPTVKAQEAVNEAGSSEAPSDSDSGTNAVG